MTDYTELKPLLEACRAENCDGPREFRKAVEALFDVCTVETISALIAENERLTGCIVHRRAQAEQYDQALIKMADERDQLKAENEALRKHQPSAEVIWCTCGDGHAANSYGAGFMDANKGVCANCDAAMGKGEQS